MWPIHENWYRVVIFSLDINIFDMEGFTALHIVDLNYTTLYQIVSLFGRYINMGQRIPWKQYGLNVTIAGAPWARAAWTKCNSQKKLLHIVTTYEKLVVNYFFLLYLCLHLDEVCISETLVLLDLAYVRQDSQKLSVVRNNKGD